MSRSTIPRQPRHLAATRQLGTALLASILVTACAAGPSTGNATEAATPSAETGLADDADTEAEMALPADIVLQIDEPTRVDGEALEVVLLEILRDSRCPVDVQCIRAGEAEVSIGLRSGAASETLSLGTPSRITSTEGEALGYRLKLLEVAPQPVSTRPLDESDYRITVRIEHQTTM
ncbi:MAG: hypothetical protein AAGC60_15470 [Acidobacteriota bacterium]